MLKAASEVKVGEYVLVNGQYRGPVSFIEGNDLVPGNVLLNGDGFTFEANAKAQVDVREETLVSGKLPRGLKVLVEKVDDGHEWVTLHNGRVIDKGYTSGTRSDAKKLARGQLEAMGLMTDE